jgi:MurNAc alpha-1-phosphate uridylyltransferase
VDHEVAGVVLAAGAGTRLRPLTRVRPKPLCPVGDRPLVDHAIERVRAVTGRVAVNVHHGRTLLEAHLAGAAVHVSVEADEALGTAGALGRLRSWLDGRAAVVVNGDTWTDAPLAELLEGWDGERTRLLLAGVDPGGPKPNLCGALMPWSAVAGLPAEPSGLWELRWRRA